MKKTVSLLFSTFLLSACVNTMDTSNSLLKTQILEKPTYVFLEEFPNIEDPNLKVFEADMPRDLSKTIIKNTSECKKIPKNKRNTDEFKKKCEEHPIINNSNIYIGFDQKNWNILQFNLITLKEKINEYKRMISFYNELIREAKARIEKESIEFENKINSLKENLP